jgi:hypothetical protein
MIGKWINKVILGKTQCCDCGRWNSLESFTGNVLEKMAGSLRHEADGAHYLCPSCQVEDYDEKEWIETFGPKIYRGLIRDRGLRSWDIEQTRKNREAGPVWGRR